MKVKRKTIPISIFLILAFALIIVVLTYTMNHPVSQEYFIFQYISECEALINADQTNVKIDRYDNASKDKNSKNLKYKKFFGMDYRSDALEYEIFAYEFADADSALKYFVNVTGMTVYEDELPLDSEDENDLFLASKGMFRYNIIIVHKNTAYQLTAPNRCEEEINELLSSVFSYKMPFSRKE